MLSGLWNAFRRLATGSAGPVADAGDDLGFLRTAYNLEIDYRGTTYALHGTLAQKLYKLSHRLTGADGENYDGIFADSSLPHRFTVGSRSNVFDTWTEINLMQTPIDDLSREIARRVADVRAWVTDPNYYDGCEMACVSLRENRYP